MTLKNYANLKKAGFNMKNHKIANFLLPTDDEEESEEVEVDQVEEYTLNFN